MDVHSFFDTMMLDGRQTQDDPALLVVVRQSLVLTVGLLLLLAAFLSRQSSSIHLWLEGSWWLVATSMATVLMITGIFQSVFQDNRRASSNVTFLRILELCELALFLILAVIANLARSRSGLNYQRARTTFWVATIVVVILWSISSLLSIVTSGHATPASVITMAATVVIAVIMIADKLVIAWNHIDPSTISDQEGHRDLSEPLVSASDKREEREGRLAARKEQKRLSQAESGEVIHIVHPYPEKSKAPAHGSGNTYKTGVLQSADDPDFLE